MIINIKKIKYMLIENDNRRADIIINEKNTLKKKTQELNNPLNFTIL